MNFETALAARLIGDGPVAAIVGTRIDWDRLVQGAVLPAIVLSIIADVRPQNMAGFDGSRGTRVQIDCVFERKPQAVALREAVLAAIVPAATAEGIVFERAKRITIRPLYLRTETRDEYREIIDLIFWHNG